MGLFLEPGKRVPVEVEGTTFYVLTLTARQQLRLVEHAEHFNASESGALDAAVLEHAFEILRIGLAGWEGSPDPITENDLDTVPVHLWGPLNARIVEVNHLGIPDQGNSSSPSVTPSES